MAVGGPTPTVTGRELVFEAQAVSGLDPEFFLVTTCGGKMMLTPPGEEFFRRVEFDGDLASGYRPDRDPDSPVRILPGVRFGKPSVKGISTEVIWEHAEVGEDADEIAEEFELDTSDVKWALSYEYAQRAA